MNADPQTQTTQRVLSVRARTDLIVRSAKYSGRTFWNIKDPLSLRYFQLRDEEYLVLQMLDGSASIESILAAFEDRFAPRKLSEEQLHRFIGMAMHQGLVVSDVAGQGDRLLERRRRAGRQRWLQSATSILAIRFRGIDPERMLRWLYPKLRWLFSKWMLAACALLAVAAVTLLFAQFDSFRSKLPDFGTFFSAANLFWIAVAIAVSKVLHEFGHALTCKHFGGECHEMGVMLLVFTPCLYCNVSDAWLMPNKWHRITISAAGIIVEITLASLCTFLWWFSDAGVFNSICLNLVFVCSVSTLLFNGNPLLRYDGYYVLSDLVEVPNLRQQAMAVVRRWLARVFLGVEIANRRMLPERRRGLLACYAVAATVYRLFVVTAILWFLHAALEPRGLKVVVQFLAVLLIGGMIVAPLWRLLKFLFHALRRGQVKPHRLAVCAALLGGAIGFIAFVPLPYRVSGPLVMEPEAGKPVFITASGTLTSNLPIGADVQMHQELARLRDFGLEREIAELEGQIVVLKNREQNLITRRARGDDVGAQLPTVQSELRDIEQRLKERQRDQERLLLRAPQAGIILPARQRTEHLQDGQLGLWTGTPLDEDNRGCFVESGTTLCVIGDARRLEAVAVVEQSEIQFVRVGQRVKVLLAQFPERDFWGEVTGISEANLKATPPELASNGQVPTTVDDDGAARPTNASFQVRVALDDRDRPLLLRGTGKVKIQVAPQSLGQRLGRYVAETFRFEL